MPLIKGGSKRTIRKNTQTEIAAGKPPNVAYAIALDYARRTGTKKQVRKLPKRKVGRRKGRKGR